MLEEHDRIVLTRALPAQDLEAGDVGTIVHAYASREAFEVEFLALDGNTVAIATVPHSHVRPVTGTDITHVRELAVEG